MVLTLSLVEADASKYLRTLMIAERLDQGGPRHGVVDELNASPRLVPALPHLSVRKKTPASPGSHQERIYPC